MSLVYIGTKFFKGMQTGQEEVKLSWFTNDMILYLKELIDSTRILLDMIFTFSKVVRKKPTTNLLRKN